MLLEHSSSACCGLGCGFYSGGQLERGILCRKLAERERRGLHSLAQCLGQERSHLSPSWGMSPTLLQASICPLSACPNLHSQGSLFHHLFHADQTSDQLMGSAPLIPLQVPLLCPARMLPGTPGHQKYLADALKQLCQCRQLPAPIASGTGTWHCSILGTVPTLGHHQGGLDPGAEQGLLVSCCPQT